MNTSFFLSFTSEPKSNICKALRVYRYILLIGLEDSNLSLRSQSWDYWIIDFYYSVLSFFVHLHYLHFTDLEVSVHPVGLTQKLAEN